MPGIVKMDNGGQNGVRTDHDRGPAVNGINGVTNAPDKGKVKSVANNGGVTPNGGEAGSRQQNLPMPQPSNDQPSRMNDLPEEIIHITQGFVPLSLLLTRLAQVTHNSVQDKIAELVKMPIPAAAINGSVSHGASSPDDTSGENLRKKANLLHFIQDMHAKWVKALVIMEWSRKSEMVSKLIDLKFHVDQQRILYDAALDNIVNVKRDLTFARMPSPDLKTALQILSTGSAPWMPDLQYIEPPTLTPDEQLIWANDLNTLLSLRLNVEDYDKIPYHFRKYEISSGRVTFKVPGEFEVDLTIADEDFEKQFWFIDFRYAFTPSASPLPESLRAYLEGCVNETLAKDGLMGCYQFLHEFVLTSKINELKRQAIQLSRSSWTGTLMVEPLNRALAIQYWTSRNPATGLKSWVLVAINSGRKLNGQLDSKSSSHLVAKWYRENKEIKDTVIDLDADNLSAESLLKNVVGQHIEFILSSIHDKLLSAPKFKNREAGMVLHISRTDPAASSLAMQVGYHNATSLLMEPTTGVFAVKPHSKFSIQYEHQLNNGKYPPEDGVNCLENVRCAITEDELNRRGSPMGWHVQKPPISIEELKSITKIRDWTRMLWLQKEGWGPEWFVAVFLSLGGDEWWLLEANAGEKSHAPKFHTRLPLNKGHPSLSQSFWSNLTLFTTGMITQAVGMRELHRHNIKSRSNNGINMSLPQQVRLPSIEVALSALFPTMVSDDGNKEVSPTRLDINDPIDDIELLSMMRPSIGTTIPAKQPWAHDIVTIKFKGVQSLSKPSTIEEGSRLNPELICISDAIIKVRKPTKFAALKGLADRDVAYTPQRGEFSLRLRHLVSEPILATLKTRIKAIDRFVCFLEAMDKSKGAIVSESVSLKGITFSYGEHSLEETDSPSQRWRVELDLSKDNIDIVIESGNPHLRVVDLMRMLVNSDGGISALVAWLPVSLPALKAIDKIETRWEAIQASGLGRLEFSMKTVAWMSLRYYISASDGFGQQTVKRLSLEVKVKARRGEAWWHVWRVDDSETTTFADGDQFSQALRPIWDSKGASWFGLATGAAGSPSSGVVGMLLAIDEAMQALVPTTSDGNSSLMTSKTTQNSNAHLMMSGSISRQTALPKQNKRNGGKADVAIVILD